MLVFEYSHYYKYKVENNNLKVIEIVLTKVSIKVILPLILIIKKIYFIYLFNN